MDKMNTFEKLAALIENCPDGRHVAVIIDHINIAYQANLTSATRDKFQAKFEELELAFVKKNKD